MELKKPAKYESKKLPAEKTNDKKFTGYRNFVQSTVTHYNFFYNANRKINEVLDRAKTAHHDDYTKLLSFYNYSLDQTRSDSIQLDSVVYKCTAAIVLHDIRNNWIDNMYLLMGQSYLLQTKFDSANRIFQFLNYHFYVKEKGDYHIPIGTRNQAQNGQLSIVNPEKRSIADKAFSRPPSRNDGLLWQVRNYTENQQYEQAAGLISILKTDPAFPKRLLPALAEQQAYWYYLHQSWDSTARYLEQALPNAGNQQELARWEYLLAQLIERTSKRKEAMSWYDKCIRHNTNPELDIYARLYQAELGMGTSNKDLVATINTLKKLAKRDKFERFKDILYLSAGQLALQIPDTPQATTLLHQSVQFNGLTNSRNQAYLLLANIARANGDYRTVAMSYDSLLLNDPALADQQNELTSKKKIYDMVLKRLNDISREDSLQRIAAMPEKERNEYIKKLLRRLRRQQGLAEEEAGSGSSSMNLLRDSLSGGTLFNNSNNNGEWYFYNAATKEQGSRDFKTHWGDRPNVDNWRRASAISQTARDQKTVQSNLADPAATKNKDAELSFNGLLSNVPLTEKALKTSNDTIASNLYALGDIYKNQLEDYPAALKVLEELHRRFPAWREEATLFNLYYCWNKVGDAAKASYYKQLLTKQYNGGPYARMFDEPTPSQQDTIAKAATETYKDVYNQFIEGNFQEALNRKKHADSLYSNSYWTPQLLYIQAVYFVHNRQDSSGIATLNQLIRQFPKHPLAEKANRLKDVVSRRAQIEQYLTNLKVVRAQEDTLVTMKEPTPAPDSVVTPEVPAHPDLQKALGVKVTDIAQQPGSFKFRFPKRDSLKLNVPTVVLPKNSGFSYDPAEAHFVMLIMDRVDVVYYNEAKNAFRRYNQDNHYNDTINLESLQLVPGKNLLLMGAFKNIQEALTYRKELKRNAGMQIVPWLAADKYRFEVISVSNMDVLKEKKNLDAYRSFVDSLMKGLEP